MRFYVTLVGDDPARLAPGVYSNEYSGMSRLFSDATPDVKNRSSAIAAAIDRAEPAAVGGIVAHGGRFDVQGNRLIHDDNYAGTHYRVASDVELPAGPLTVRLGFTKTRQLVGIATLDADGTPIGEGRIERTQPNRISDEGLDVGRDSFTPVRDGDAGHFDCTGTLKRVVREPGDDQKASPAGGVRAGLGSE